MKNNRKYKIYVKRIIKRINIFNKFYQIRNKIKIHIFYQRDKIHKILYKNKYYQNSKFKKKY
jgi:hypothetical protein